MRQDDRQPIGDRPSLAWVTIEPDDVRTKRVSNPIPPLDLTRQFQTIQAEVANAVTEVLASGRYINGAVVTAFEDAFAAYTGTAYSVGCNSGTDALYLALRALQIGPGDEVITTPFTFFATTEVISAVGATPVFVDIDLETFNLDPNQIEAAITPRTKAIMPVHLFGRPAPMTTVLAIAAAHDLYVIEDCAQATGAAWQQRKVGSFGQIGCFSFFPTKNLGACGDGGAVTVNDPALMAEMRMLREHGSRERYYHEAIGINSRLDAVQAAILQIKLQYLDRWNAQRQQVAQRYQDLLGVIPGLALPIVSPPETAVWNQYTIRVLDSTLASRSDHPNLRDRLRQALQAEGISSMVYYPLPLHLQPVYQAMGWRRGQFPKAELAAHQVLALPMFPELTAAEQERIAYAIKDQLPAAKLR